MHENDHDVGTILGVWAHPDDETYLSAGLMAMAWRAGRNVTCVTATRGEHGTDDPARWPPARLARTRDHEVAAAMAILGVTDHRCLGYEDGTLADADQDEGAKRIASIIEEVAPDTILTFGPDGGTGHPDHIAISRWTTSAYQVAGRTGRLLYATNATSWVDGFVKLGVMDQVMMTSGSLPSTPDAELALDVELDDEVRDQKLAALRAQATQTTSMVLALGEDQYAAWTSREMFRDAL
jgi:LmbE family N-acetylglucosaminyl deacetylase